MKRPNIILFTVDDLNYNSLGYTGCTVRDISPNLDKLASESIYFKNAHVSIAVCQPSRSVLFTGKHPHRNGATAFNAISPDITTLTQLTRGEGYHNGILSKVNHLQPEQQFCWDYIARLFDEEQKQAATAENYDLGRRPKSFYEHTDRFIKQAKAEGKPFLLMANSNDPHRPFVGSDDEQRIFGFNTECSRTYTAEETETVPGFLPDLPDVRKELAEYYSSVHRADESVGELMRAVEENGVREDTVIFFLSDNGMAFPYAKTNCYLTSTRTPLIVSWPGKIKAGVNENMVSGIDFMPTVLDLISADIPNDLDGESYKDVLLGSDDINYKRVFTTFNQTSGKRNFPMRCVMDNEFGYIFNAWSDGECMFHNESMGMGITYPAMKAAAVNDSKIADRVNHYVYRCKEELYDLKNDPDALCNLADKPEYKQALDQKRKELLDYSKNTNDFVYENIVKQLKEIGYNA